MTRMRIMSVEYLGMKFLMVVTVAHIVATDPQSPIRKRKKVENTHTSQLKSVRVKVASVSKDKKEIKPHIRNVFHGSTVSIKCPPTIPEK